jgi:thiol:disulfide interchange protein DsbA
LQGLHRGCSVVSVFDDFELQAISFLEDFSMRFASLYVAALLLTMTGSIPSAADAWRVGVHYIQLDNAEPAKLPVGEIEVVEFFWYSCPHCNAFEPFLLEWLKRKPAAVDFERIPVTWDANQESDARLYYVLRALRREDLHQAVFDTVHKQHKVLNTPDLQAEFSVLHGVAPQAFANALHSPEVERNLKRADQRARHYKIAGVPSIVINGKYATSVYSAGGNDRLIALIDYLVAREKGVAAP